MMQWGALLKRAFFGTIVCAGLWTAPARAVDRYWVGGSGDWNQASHWSLTEGGRANGGVPLDGDAANLHFGDAVNRQIQISGDLPLLSHTEADSIGSGALVLKLTGGAFGSGDLQLQLATDGRASFIQSGGVHTAFSLNIGQNPGSDGAYTLSGGLLDVSQVSVSGGGHASFVQTGGIHKIFSSLYMDIGSTYLLSKGQVEAQTLSLGERASMTQSGGSAKFTFFNVRGDYDWAGGTLDIQR
jgi:hypothetical protein